jgi:aspartate-semialdehyde dehydrogenase
VRIDIAPAPCFRKRRALFGAAPDQVRCRARGSKRRPNAPRADRRGETLTRAPACLPGGRSGSKEVKQLGGLEGDEDKEFFIMSGFKVAVAGATGNVGREMLSILAERRFPAAEVVALASPASIGREVSFGDKTLKCRALEHYDFSDTDICLMSAGGAVSKDFSPRIGAKGCVVIDNSSAWRMDPDVPLVVPEVNAAAAKGFGRKNIVANPNCSTAQLVVALKPLHDHATIRRAVVATYQSVSGAGKEAMDELFSQTRAVFISDPIEAKKFPKRIAFNVIPHIDVFMDDGSTKEEWKMVAETKKILDPKIRLTATCVRVPVFIGHSEAVNLEFEKPISAEEARDILSRAPGCLVVDRREPGGYITPHEAAGEDATYISRIREDPTIDNGLNLWVVSDNLRKGAALNAVQIAEVLANRGWLSPKMKAA